MFRRFSKRRTFVMIWLVHYALAAMATNAEGYEVHLVDGPITNHVVLADTPLPPVCKPLEDVRLHGCRGQSLPLSFVITTAQSLEGVLVNADAVQGAERVWPGDAVDLHVVKDYYRNTIFSHMAAMPSLLVHDDSLLSIEPAPTDKDPGRMTNVAKRPMLDADTLQPVDIVGRRQFWVTIRIPDHAKPGEYETTVRIKPAGGNATEFNVAIEVHPFDLLEPMIEYSIYYPAYLEAGLS